MKANAIETKKKMIYFPLFVWLPIDDVNPVPSPNTVIGVQGKAFYCSQWITFRLIMFTVLNNKYK